jgi:hypothetical protein
MEDEGKTCSTQGTEEDTCKSIVGKDEVKAWEMHEVTIIVFR